MIACLTLPHFAAALEERDDPALAETAFVLVDPDTPQRTVYASSQQAYMAGVRQGMSLKQAESVCPGLDVLTASPAASRQATTDLVLLLTGYSEQVELQQPTPRKGKTSPAIQNEDAVIVCLDLAGTGQDEALEMARLMHTAMREQLGLSAFIGVAAGKFTARVAASSLAQPELLMVRPDHSAEFLAPYPSSLLPLYPEQAEKLKRLGLHTLGSLAALPASAMLDLFGTEGRLFHRWAKGVDNSPLAPYHPPTTEHITRQLEEGVSDRLMLGDVLREMATQLAQQLAQKSQATHRVTLVATLGDKKKLVREVTLRQPTSSGQHLGDTAIELASSMTFSAEVIELGLILSDLVVAEARQLSLFELETTSAGQLQAALRELVARHGEQTFLRVSLSGHSAALPDRRVRLRPALEP
jgi:DNA polymerase IV